MTLVQMILHNWVAALVLLVVIARVITEIAKQIRKFGCYQQEIALKRDLVERGLSVDEIERIVAAKSSTTSKDTA